MVKAVHRIIIALAATFGAVTLSAQNVNVEDITNIKDKKAIKLSGGITANSTWYNATEMFGRQPLTWQVGGNLNVSLFELIDIPLSINLNNFGAQYSYPSLPNRLSIHPSYKWARLHIGDVSMSFSPYTLSGHLFTGGGVELTPGKWSVSAMGGRLVRKVDYDPELPSVLPSYERWGTGAKIRYNGTKSFVGVTFFAAEDRCKEISFQADSLGVRPKKNVTASVEGGVNIAKNLRLSAEYAISRLSQLGSGVLIDPETGEARPLEDEANMYDAVKAALDYTFYKNTVGVGYERIDPEYATLGGYYFNNDYENLTLNYARPLFGDKGNIALSGGVQRDDLDGSKQSRNTRFVGSANLSVSPSDRLNMALSASTFQGYRVIKSQFDYINQTKPYENLDTLNFAQISRNVDFNLNWIVQSGEKSTQNISFFTSYQESADRQGAYILPGNLSRFLNASVMYGIDLTAIRTYITTGYNVSNSYSNMRNFLTQGPTFAATLRLAEGKFTTGLTFSFNRSYDESSPVADVLNLRWNANARLFKRHSIQASAMLQRQRRMSQTPEKKTRSITGQIGYMYNF